MDNLTNAQILEHFPYCLRDNISKIWTNEKIGLSATNLQLKLFPRKFSHDCQLHLGNNFIIEVPYAGRRLHWEVFFTDEDNTFAPDFDFINDQFLSDPDVNTILENIPGLVEWDVKNPNAFITVIKQLLDYYKICQLRKLESESRFSSLHKEYLLLKQDLNMDDEDLEVYIDNTSVHFLIALKLNFSSLPVYIQKSYFKEGGNVLNPGEDTATLQITFGSNRTTTYLQFSPRLENALGDCKSLHIPPYEKDSNIAEYINLVHQLLDDKVENIKQQYTMKQEYISVLLSLHAYGIIEYDNIEFSKALILIDADGFHVLVHFVLTNKFPQEKPLIMLRSIYHRLSGKPAVYEIREYPYSPRWNPAEMVKRLMKRMYEEVPKFKSICTKN